MSSDPSVELSSNRTAMSFERTAMSSDRTLMSSVRTAISLIGFGFTIFQFFRVLNEKLLETQLPARAPARVGGVFILLGMILLVMALWYNRREVSALRARRQRLFDMGLIRHLEIHKQSATVAIAVLMLMLGAFAMASVITRAGLF
jgi:putative membrane protein